MRRDLVVNAFTWEAINTRVIKPQSTARRPILNVDDSGWVVALSAVLPNVQGVYNVCAENVTVTQIARRVADFTGTQVLDYVGDDGDKRDYWMDNSRLLYHFEIRSDELVTTDNPTAIKAVETCLTGYHGSLRTRTEIYKEMKGQ
jgi:nucleoside-diphosphate-sugar epimerase